MAAAPTGPRAAAGAHDDGESECVCGAYLAHEAAAGVYLQEGVGRALEDNQRQIAEAEQRQRKREEREQAEAKAAGRPIAPPGTPSTAGQPSVGHLFGLRSLDRGS